jgi:YjbE family integral membrane protein
MEMTTLGGTAFGWDFVVAFFSIVLIDLILAGDNAVVIAMAVRSLSPQQRRRGIIVGSAGAVLLRVALTFFAAKLLTVGGVKFLGGILILWIAVRLFAEGAPVDKFRKTATTLRQAIITIVVADLAMSTDNVLAVAGASKGNLFLLVFGLGLSIPFVVLTSSLLSRLMDRYPFIVYVGAAILGRVAGEMIITDPYLRAFFRGGPVTEYCIEALFAVGVIVAGRTLLRVRAARTRTASEAETFDIVGVFSK